MRRVRFLNVLIACEESQAECSAFRKLGHNAFSCDVQECIRSGNPSWHIHSDVTPFLLGKVRFVTQDGSFHKVPRWDLIIAHPPCTYLCKVSSVQLHKNADLLITFGYKRMFVNSSRYDLMKQARDFFMLCYKSAAQYVAVENPCPMKLANLPPADAFACPSWYGYKYTKKTYYWLKNLPPLFPEYINTNTKCLVHCTRGKYRSRTYPGLASAIAKQWGDYVLNDINHKILNYGKKQTNLC